MEYPCYKCKKRYRTCNPDEDFCQGYEGAE